MNEGDVEEAIQRVREGSVDAYEIVVGACQGRLRSMIANVCPPGIEPDEVAHLAFTEAFHRIDQYTPNTRFIAWLAAIARFVLLKEMRKLRREAKTRENYLEQILAQTLEAELEARSDLDDLRVRALRGCVAALPDATREILRMRYAGDTPIRTISSAVGKSIGAVKVQLLEIRRKLRECVTRKLSLVQR